MMRDLNYAWRQLARNPGFAVVVVGSLAIGIALIAVTLATANAYLFRSLPFPTARDLHHVRYAPPGPWEPARMSAIDWNALGDVVADAITTSGATLYSMDGGTVAALRALQVAPGFFPGLGLQPAAGRIFVPEEFDRGAAGVAMISHELWRDRFGADAAVIGRTIDASRDETGRANEALKIVGVLPPGFWFGRNSSAKVDVLLPLRFKTQTYMVRLRSGVPVALAEKRLTEAARSVGGDFRPGWSGVHLESAHDRYVAGIRPILSRIAIAVGAVFVLVCANITILLLLRAMRRQREVAVRISLGADWKQVARMLLTEAGLICGIAVALGLLATTAALRRMATTIETQLGSPAPAGNSASWLDSPVLLALTTVCLTVTALFAIVPLVANGSVRLADALRAQGAGATSGHFMHRLRNALIVLEVGGSLALAVGAGLMIRSMVNLIRTDIGFNPENVIRVGIRLPAANYGEGEALHRFFAGLQQRIPREPGSQMTLMTAFPPFYPANQHEFEAAESASKEGQAGMLQVGDGYFGLYGVKLVEGREFMANDRPGSEPVALVSESFARQHWPEGSSVGRRVRVVEGDMPQAPLGPWRTIVGVVGDIRQGFEDTDLRDVYVPFAQSPRRFASVHIKTRQPAGQWEQAIRAAVREIEPYAQVSPAASIVSQNRQLAGARTLTWMLSAFAGFAALLAAIGIHGVTAYAVRQREREIAIRVAVGADRRAILRMFLKEGGVSLGLGLALGLIGAFGTSKILSGAMYRVEPLDALTFAAACGTMAGIGILSILRPSWSAARTDPATSLRAD